MTPTENAELVRLATLYQCGRCHDETSNCHPAGDMNVGNGQVLCDECLDNYIEDKSGFVGIAAALEATARPTPDSYWHSIDTAPEDQHVILATTGGFVGEAIMLLDETTGKQKWAWALGPVHPNHVPLGWQHMPAALTHPIPRDDRPGGFDGPTGAD